MSDLLNTGLIGYPLSHSFSPEIHKRLGGYPYELYAIPPRDLDYFLHNNDLDAFNVTVPHKKAVLPYMDFLSNEAKAVGAVNTVKKINGKYYGYNTDVDGFRYLLDKNNIDVKNKKILILGTGGASLAVQTAVLPDSPREIITVSRQGNINYSSVYSLHPDADIIINATPVGMFPHINESIIDISRFPKISCVIDLIYNPLRTRLLVDAQKKGIQFVNGLSMLVYQAQRSSMIFGSETSAEIDTDEIVTSLTQKNSNIVLVGMPGCGKSLIGKLLAKKLGMDFVDSDKEIIRTQQMSIADIFREKGESCFRRMEADILRKIGSEHGKVIATGGGAVVTPENDYSIHANGTVFWIQRELELLSDRGRPLSQTKTNEVLFSERKVLYRRFSDIAVDNNGSPNQAVYTIIKEWRK